ncbi:Isochorismatase hydrolase [Cadophora sp. DSE1049]|nr:Isochorismatase hydrolase [Cadophora sp. DSE1049]
MPAMFEIDEQNIPFVRTRQAFLLLDLQNDFISTGCALPVENPPNFIDNILKVTPEFRNIGNVIWIRSIFEASRPVNGSGAGSEKVITDEQLSPKHRAALHANGRAADPEAIAADGAERDSVEETFLTIPLGGTASVVLPQSPGSNLSQAAVTGYDPDRDTFFQKSHYSAFKDGGLVQILRARFVTELYICGALTNISVFATAMDAAHYGYAITIIKTRRRPSKSVSKERAAEKAPASPTSATLAAASQKLEKLPTPVTEETGSEVTTTQEVSSQYTESVTSTTKSETAHSNTTDGMAPKNGKEVESSSDHVGKITKAQTEDGPSPICEGDTTIINGLLDDDASEGIFEKLRDEVRWQKMSHQGGDVPRLMAVQGQVAEDGSVPVYRHPADESPPLLPFSPTVSLIQAQVEKKLGHAVNHVLIQFYRDGNDYISEHSDKTLDIAPKTFIANQPKSNGDSDATESAQPRQACRAPLPHNSMCKMGLVTNMRWLHGIRQDKRMTSEKTEAELAFNGGRISLTFRLIGTFLDKDQQKIWGQGAVAKSKKDARMVINWDTPEAEKMVRAFGQENHSSEFDWKESYGEGFDVLHMENDPKLFVSGDSVADLRAKILLAEYGVTWTEGKLSLSFNWKDESSGNEATPVPEKLPVKFVDNDLSKSTVTGDFRHFVYNSPRWPIHCGSFFVSTEATLLLCNIWIFA